MDRQKKTFHSPQQDWQRVWRRYKRAGWAPMGSSWSSRGIFQWPEGSPWEVWGLNPKLGFPDWSTSTGKGIQIISSCEKQWDFCLPGRDSLFFKRKPLKKRPAHQNSGLQPFILGSWGGSGVGGAGKRTEGTAVRIPVLNHSTYYRSHLSQAEHSPPSGISLKGSNSPACRALSHPAELKPGCWLQLD